MAAKIKDLLTLGLVLTAVALVGCVSHDAARSDRDEFNQIVDIAIDNDPESLILNIQANKPLNYTEDRIADPNGIVISFPGTKIGGLKGLYTLPENEIVRYVRADTYAVNELPVATIYIALQADTPYGVTRDDAGLRVTFSRHPGLSDKTAPRAKPAEIKPEPPGIAKLPPTATALVSVNTKTYQDALALDIVADGTITEYHAFTIENPARIVFDIFKLESPYFAEQIIKVQSKMARQIRYCGHPDKLRLVIDTHKEYLSKYSSTSTDTGLMITVGKLPQ